MAGVRYSIQVYNNTVVKLCISNRFSPSTVVYVSRNQSHTGFCPPRQNLRCFATSRSYADGKREHALGQSTDTLVSAHSNQNLVDPTPSLYRERFIPLTRRTTVSYLLQDEQKLTVTERKEFEKFALSLDAVINTRYTSTLEELKQLFDPISPDKDTVTVRQFSRDDRLENEFWLLQRLSQVMEKANFYELTDDEIKSRLNERERNDGVRVSVDRHNYDILKFWVLGKQEQPVNHSLFNRMVSLFRRDPLGGPSTIYRRVIAAVRLKQDDKLTLKAFKDIPTDDLEKILPIGNIKMGRFDRLLIMSSLSLASAGLLAKLVTYLAKMHVYWPLGFAAVSSLLGVRGYMAYTSRKSNYLSRLNSTLYYKNIANNRGLITLVVDRAQDESFKEALLTYTFTHALSRGQRTDLDQGSGKVTGVALENAIEQWIYEHTGTIVEFDSSESIAILEKVGILSRHSSGLSQTLTVLPLEQARRLLPQTPLSILTRVEESDVTEGYDRTKSEDKKARPSAGSSISNSFLKKIKIFGR